MKKKIIITIIAISTLIIGTTYAWFSWAIEFRISETSECFDIDYTKGKDIGSNENKKTLILGNSHYDGLSTTVQVKTKDTCDINVGKGTLYLNTEETTSKAILESNTLKYQVVNGNNLTTSGTINQTGKTIIYEDFDITNDSTILTIYVWIDASLLTDDIAEEVLASTYYGNISLDVESR